MPTGHAHTLRRMPPSALARPNALPTTSRTRSVCPPGSIHCELKASTNHSSRFIVRNRPSGSTRVVEHQLQHAQIEPAPELGAHLRHASDLDEAQAFVQGDGGGVPALDPRDHHVHPRDGGALDERGHQGRADAATVLTAENVDRVLDRESVAAVGTPLRV